MSNKGNNVFHATNSQINISNDQSTINAKLNVNGHNREDRLLTTLQQLLEVLNKEKVVNPDLSELSNNTEDLIEDLKANDLSERRLRRFHDKLNQLSPEIQLSSVLLAAISAVNDAVQLFLGT